MNTTAPHNPALDALRRGEVVILTSPDDAPPTEDGAFWIDLRPAPRDWLGNRVKTPEEVATYQARELEGLSPEDADLLRANWDAAAELESMFSEPSPEEAEQSSRRSFEASRDSYRQRPDVIERERVARESDAREAEAKRKEADYERQVRERADRMRVEDAAKRLIAAERAGVLHIPNGVSLTDLLEREIDADEFLVDEAWQIGGNVVFSAQRKAGKTTVVHNLVRSLVDGDPFLDHFPMLKTRRVALLDFELSDSMAQRWLRRQNIKNADHLLTFHLRGRSSSFNILDDRVRARWASRLSGYEVLILDPLRPILDALGVNEWSETGPFLQAFDALKEEAGIGEGLIAHHHGHHSERASGDSRLEGWPDAIWNLTRDDATDPRSFRYFDAYGRDINIERGLLSMYGDSRLAFAADSYAGKTERLIDLIAEQLQERGELKADDIAALGIRGVSKNTVRGLLDEAVRAGVLKIRVGNHNAKMYGPGDSK